VEKEFEKVKGALEDFGKKVVEAVKKGKGEADKVTKVAQLRIEVGSLNRQLGDLYRELGELFYRNYNKPGKAGQELVAETVTHIAAVEKKIAGLKRHIKAVREDKPVPRRGRPAKAEREAPKRRGRLPKKAAAKTTTPKRRSRPPKSASAETVPVAPKRRGRPPKAKTE